MAERNVNLKLSRTDSQLVHKVLTALVASPEACHRVLSLAGKSHSYPAEQVGALVRIAHYIETVGLAD